MARVLANKALGLLHTKAIVSSEVKAGRFAQSEIDTMVGFKPKLPAGKTPTNPTHLTQKEIDDYIKSKGITRE